VPLTPLQALLPACPQQTSKYRQVRQHTAPSQSSGLNNQGFFFFFFFFWRNDQTRGWGQNFLQETASPRLTVNKYSLLAALPSTVRALAPIVFQVQTGKGRKESEMADRRFNLLLLQLSLVGCLQFSRAASCLELPLHPTFPVNLPNCVPWAGSPRGQHTTGCPKAKGRSASQDQICRLRPMGWLET
jgi:hypothetical protein